MADDFARFVRLAAREAGLPLSEARLWETSISRASCRDQARGER